MQVQLETLDELERKLTVKIPADKLDQQVSERVTRMGREVQLKGFRPGRVPKGVIEKRYGVQIRNEELGNMIGASFQEAIRQEDLKPAGSPTIETDGQAQAGEIAYTARFEVMPELPDVDVADFKVERPVAEVADSDVDNMIETLRKQRRTFETVDRAAASDDMVVFEFRAETSDGLFPDSGRERTSAVLGGGQFNAELEQSLVGLAAGDDFEREVTFAEPFKYEELAGKLSKVSGQVVRVQEAHLPEVNEAFFKAFGIDEGGEEGFRREVRANLERELGAAMSGSLKGAVAEALATAYADLKLPKVMVASQARALLRMDESDTLSEQQFRQFEPVARKRVIAGLLLAKIARDQDIAVDSQRVGRTLAAIASTFEDPDQLVEIYRNDEKLMRGLQDQVLEEQVAEWVAEHAECVDKPVSFNDLLQPSAPA